MSKVNPNTQLGYGTDVGQLQRTLKIALDGMALVINQIAKGEIIGSDSYASVPTSGTWKQGDQVKNSAPVEAGAAASKYVVIGWIRVTSGTANVLNTDWVAMRTLTGN